MTCAMTHTASRLAWRQRLGAPVLLELLEGQAQGQYDQGQEGQLEEQARGKAAAVDCQLQAPFPLCRRVCNSGYYRTLV